MLEIRMLRSRRPIGTLLAATFTLAACHDSTDNDRGPTDEQTAAVGLMIRDEVESALDGLTLPTTLQPLGTDGDTACVAASDPTDSDGDGIPNDAGYIFVAPPCRFGDFRGGTLDVVGDLRIQDPAPDAAGFGYRGALTALRNTLALEGNTPGYTVTRNGLRTLSGSVAGLQLSSDMQVAHTFAGQPDAAVDEQLTFTFAPATQLQINRPLPSGTFDIAGTVDWTRGTEAFTLTVTTPTPLHFDATCTGTPQRFDAGELQAAGTFGERTGFVRVRWTDCGRDPDVGFVGE